MKSFTNIKNGVTAMKTIYFLLLVAIMAAANSVIGQNFTNVRVNHITAGEQVMWGGNSLAVYGNNVYTLWQDRDTYFSYVSKSTNGGVTFNNGVKVGENDPQMFGSITIDNSGSVYVAWSGAGFTGIYFAKSTNEAATFSAPLTISLTGFFAQIAVYGNNVYIFFYNTKSNNKIGFFFTRSTNGGSTFAVPYEITDATIDDLKMESPNSIYVDNSGVIYCVWNDGRRIGTGSDIYIAKSTNNGVSFGANIMVNDISGSSDNKRLAPTVAVSGSNVYAVWREEDGSGNNRKILFGKSINGGTSFGAEKEISSANASPYLAINSAGEIYIAYPGSTTLPSRTGLFCSKSNDQGATFPATVFISATNTDAKNPSIYVNGNDILHAVWCIGLDNNQDDVYFAKGKITILTAPTATSATAISKTSFTANWNEVTSAIGYYLDVSINSTFTDFGPYGINNKDVGNVKTFTLTNLIPNTSHFYRVRAYNSDGTGPNSNTVSVTLVGVKDDAMIPTEYKLEQNYPNPFNPSTVISWQSPVGSHTTLKVYDMLGREVATLVNEFKQAGSYVETLRAASLTSGVYFYRLTSGSFTQTKKFVLMK